MRIHTGITVIGLLTMLGFGAALAEPKPSQPDESVLSPYVGQCVAVVFQRDEDPLPGVIVMADDNHAVLDVSGIQVIVFLSRVLLAVPDPTGELEFCATEPDTGLVVDWLLYRSGDNP